ncbi:MULTISPECIES: hypothetical protein [unclassified Janthinobacterium]|uniref:hypothetical protein n=1 Tax=unclassified Janthinobacterium TaxID=2610881 RepID=UPI0018076D44|nr:MULTISPECIES: hypothetical protein [unclassified Janthinobacterium]MBB5610409.1 hypothetical protein [Janthinobacterium sp. S3T4]MBB5615754.1 hypothetical protein [Janthinobacterium sp. S3M3]
MSQGDIFSVGAQRLQMTDSIDLTIQSLLAYGATHEHWGIAWSGGKDSSATLTLITYLLDTGKIARPKSLTVFYADTRQELPPLAIAARQITDELQERGIRVEIANQVIRLDQPQFCLDGGLHFLHFFYRHRIGRSKGVTVLRQSAKTSISQIFVNLIAMYRGHVVSLLKTLYENVVQANTADKAIRMSIPHDNKAAQIVIRDLPESGGRGIVDWEWTFHDWDHVKEGFPGRNIHQKLTVSHSKTIGNDNHLIEQISKKVPHLFRFSDPRLLLSLPFLPVRYPYCNSDRDYGANSLYPGWSIATGPRNVAKAVAACKAKQCQTRELNESFHKFPRGYWQHINMSSLWRAV